jgi:cytochrome P450
MVTTAGRIPPGPKGKPLVGVGQEMQQDIVTKLMEGFRQYGDIVRFPIPRYEIYLLGHPDHVKHVLQDNNKNYPKIPLVDNKFMRISGEGLLTASGPHWMKQRRLTQPAFHRQRIRGFARIMTETTAKTLERWQPHADTGEPLDMRVEMMKISLDIMSQTLFSTDMGRYADVIGEAVSVMFEHTHTRLNAIIDPPLSVPLPSNRRFVKSRENLDRIVYGLITERRQHADAEDTGEFLSILMDVRDEETGEGMSDVEIRDEIMTFIFAGHETVSTGLTWVLVLLSQHPAVRRRLHEEADAVLGGRTPTVEDVPKLRYTSMVIDEALRLYPPIWLIARTPVEDDEIAGFRVPAGTFVFCPPYVVHRNPDFWENPQGFDPERMAPERQQGRHRYAYFPFGGGPRKCIGDYFGLLEMQLVVPMIAQTYDLELLPGHPIVPQPAVSLRVKDGLPMTVRAYKPPPTAHTPEDVPAVT